MSSVLENNHSFASTKSDPRIVLTLQFTSTRTPSHTDKPSLTTNICILCNFTPPSILHQLSLLQIISLKNDFWPYTRTLFRKMTVKIVLGQLYNNLYLSKYNKYLKLGQHFKIYNIYYFLKVLFMVKVLKTTLLIISLWIMEHCT